MRDTISGVSAIKRSGSLYLPIPSAMTSEQPSNSYSIDQSGLGDNIAINAPWQHDIPAYSSFIQRARFPDMTSLLLMGLTGISIKKKAEINLPSNISYLLESATKDGKTLEELFTFLVIELLSVGRISLLLEVNKEQNKFYINTYSAESFINWKDGFSGMKKSVKVPRLAVFNEPNPNEDEFTHNQELIEIILRDQIEVTTLSENGDLQSDLTFQYNVCKNIDGVETKKEIPTMRSNSISFIPCVTANAYGLGLDVGNCPLIGVSDIAISIYQKDADMSNAEFLTCNPMLVTVGVSEEVDENGSPINSGSIPIGSNVTMNLPDPESNAFYVEPKSTCLQHMIVRIQDLKDEAAQYGSSVLASNKKASEAAETLRIRQSGNSSSLRAIIKSAGEAIEQILQFAYLWDTNQNVESKEIEFKPNLDLTEADLSPQAMTALLNSMMNQGISKETYLLNLKAGGVKLSSETIQEEITKIENQSPDLVE